jgi:glycosyltransferase involved in cell wall biosynthesis
MQLVIDARKAFDSGIGTYIRAVVPRVVARLDSVEVTLLVRRGTTDAHRYVESQRVTRVEIDAPPFSFAEQLELRRHLNASTLFWATSLAHPLWSKTPLVATVHDVAQLALARDGVFRLPVRLASRVYFNSLRHHARAMFVNSEFTRDELVRHLGGGMAQPICVTPLGVEPEWFAARSTSSRPGTRPYFICVGNVRPHKNLRTMVEAFERIAERVPHELLIVGQQEGQPASGGELANSHQRTSARVRFAGFVPDADLRAFMAGADALVFPSLYEGFGLPALEAMAAGCPVIASRAGALPEVCGDAATYFDPRAIAQLSERLLEHAVLTADQRRRMVERGVAHARAYTWDRTAELTAKGLAEIMVCVRQVTPPSTT